MVASPQLSSVAAWAWVFPFEEFAVGKACQPPLGEENLNLPQGCAYWSRRHD
jgi:hypothetical protein